ncbi:MAG: thioesterase family protein [Pseudomonadota bacterium]
MAFRVTRQVRFGDCDPAGIVFYPRYFEMINAVVEDWFASLDAPFTQIILRDGHGVPTVSVSAQFKAASRLGDSLTFHLAPLKLGRASLDLGVKAVCRDETRLTARPVLVWIDGAAMKARPWPAALRAKIAAAIETSEETGHA